MRESTPISRQLLVDRVLRQGWTYAAAGEAAGVSRRTVGKWVQRFRQGAPRPSRTARPGRGGRRIRRRRTVALIRQLRVTHGLPAWALGRALGVPRSTVSAWLRRLGLNRPAAEPHGARAALRVAGGRRHDASRHQAARPLPPSRAPRPRRSPALLTGGGLGVRPRRRRRSHAAGLRRGAAGRRAAPPAGRFSQRAIAWYQARGITCQRVLTDNGSGYCRPSFATAAPPRRCAIGARGRTRPAPMARRSASSRRLLREWAYARRTPRPRSAGGRSAPGCGTTTASAHMPVSAISRRSPGCRELPDEQRV